MWAGGIPAASLLWSARLRRLGTEYLLQLFVARRGSVRSSILLLPTGRRREIDVYCL